MLKPLLLLYSICCFCYIFYTREPDYFDSEHAVGTVFCQANNNALVKYYVGKDSLNFSVKNYLGYFENNEKVDVIYKHNEPKKATIYNFFYYWFNPNEFFFSVFFFIALFYVAVLLNKNAFEPKEEPKFKERKYD